MVDQTFITPSVTKLGEFLKFLWTCFIPHVAQIKIDFWASLLSKTAVPTFWATYGKIWAPFNLNIWSHWLRLQIWLGSIDLTETKFTTTAPLQTSTVATVVTAQLHLVQSYKGRFRWDNLNINLVTLIKW